LPYLCIADEVGTKGESLIQITLGVIFRQYDKQAIVRSRSDGDGRSETGLCWLAEVWQLHETSEHGI